MLKSIRRSTCCPECSNAHATEAPAFAIDTRHYQAINYFKQGNCFPEVLHLEAENSKLRLSLQAYCILEGNDIVLRHIIMSFSCSGLLPIQACSVSGMNQASLNKQGTPLIFFFKSSSTSRALFYPQCPSSIVPLDTLEGCIQQPKYFSAVQRHSSLSTSIAFRISAICLKASLLYDTVPLP